MNIRHKSYFDEFEIRTGCSEANLAPSSLGMKILEFQAKQLEVFNELEADLPIRNAESFGDYVHFQGSVDTSVQRWYPYREGYSVRLVSSFIRELGITGNVFDPFCGSGTTLLSSRINNLNSFGVDVNPISTLIAQVENEKYNRIDIKDIRTEICFLENIEKTNVLRHTNFHLAQKVFNQDILQSMIHLKNHLSKIKNEKTRNLFLLAWLSIIEEVSNVKKEGNGIKYKNRKRTSTGYITIDKDEWEKDNFPDNKFSFVKNKLLNKLQEILYDIEHSYGSCEKKPHIYQGDCLKFDEYFSDEIQLTFFSPPYCNCFDYFEIHKVELWLGDFVTNKEEYRLMRNSGFRSNTNSLNGKPILYKNDNLEKLIKLLDVEKLWSKRIPEVINGYFDDMHTLLKKIYNQTVRGGYVGIVVGNSAYTGIIIPTDVIIADIAKNVGFKVSNIFVTRHLTTSSQQKTSLENLKKYLRESIVLLEK